MDLKINLDISQIVSAICSVILAYLAIRKGKNEKTNRKE